MMIYTIIKNTTMTDLKIQQQAEHFCSRYGEEAGFARVVWDACAKWMQERDKWISCEDRLPSLSEINKPNNWKFIVCNKEDNWTDAAYLNYKKEWHNGECVINPTHWQPLPSPPKD